MGVSENRGTLGFLRFLERVTIRVIIRVPLKRLYKGLYVGPLCSIWHSALVVIRLGCYNSLPQRSVFGYLAFQVLKIFNFLMASKIFKI